MSFRSCIVYCCLQQYRCHAENVAEAEDIARCFAAALKQYYANPYQL
jgi:hypothetical protein